MKVRITYWCNLNLRDKYFGYKETDDLVYVGTVEADGLDDAYEKFNRIDQPVPVLDEAQAPSMSVGDVAQVYGDPRSATTGEAGDWYAVARIGFDPIKEPAHDRLIRAEKVGDVISARVDEINRNRNQGTV